MLTTLFAGVAVAKTFVCRAIPCEGTNNSDRIGERNGSVADIIRAGGGDDEVNANRAGNDTDDVLGQSGSDVLFVQDGDFRDNANCGSGDEDVAIIDLEFIFDGQFPTANVDGVRGCELLVFDFGPPPAQLASMSNEEIIANSTPVPERAVRVAEAKAD